MLQCIASWNNRRTDFNITNNDWRNPIPGGEQIAIQCVSAVTVQSVKPATQLADIASGTYKVISR